MSDWSGDIANSLFNGLMKGLWGGTKMAVNAGRALSQQAQIEKIEKAQYLLEQAINESGEYELIQKAYESLKNKDFDDCIYYSQKAIENGNEAKSQLMQ